jgi:hypothetical protein
MPSPFSKSFLLLATFVLALGSGCDLNGQESGPRVLSGVWEGPITHPNPDFSGTLTLQITQTGNTLSGSATWAYPGRRLSGSLSGGAPDEGPIAYTLDFGSQGVYFHTIDGSGDALSGTWESRRGINGTVSLRRQ